jgi:eukaryotic translation initiation factor 2C
MVRERLQAWTKERKAETSSSNFVLELPKSIFYYRDGVGTGQYNTIKTDEVAAIRRAYRSLAEEYHVSPVMNIHAVVVVKRHHTWFYPVKKAEGDPFGNSNTLPGTFVDRLVTSPYYRDFYLQSHIGIKGAVKPTHYFVLEDGIPDLALEKLRDLVSTSSRANSRLFVARC